jgi:hypothetical protein
VTRLLGLPLQDVPGPQATPQLPQLPESVWKLVHTPLQQRGSAGPQTWPQEPQFLTSTARFVQLPLQQVPLQQTRFVPDVPHSRVISPHALQTFSQPERSGPGKLWH